MNPKFREAVESLHPNFERLIRSAAHGPTAKLPVKGVYLFSEKGKTLYVGRSDNIPRRFSDHRRPSSGVNKASFANRIVCDELGLKADYRPGPNTYAEREKNPKFAAAFQRAKERIRAMEFRAVEEPDPTRQALLEVYCAISADARYNDFRNH